ncbi:CobW family GTP-binding protein [Peribacillus glennii]|uniref:hypothetical protein n=1 Tax=Peribacillus glennii TaxID=2303991 RepID=UPI0018F1F288|nr:hypothetical protein [Peribacillus glennii]
MQHHLYIESVIASVGAKNGILQLKNNLEMVKQVTVADKIALTNTDITPSEQKEELISRLMAINPAIEIIEVVHGNADASQDRKSPKSCCSFSFHIKGYRKA